MPVLPAPSHRESSAAHPVVTLVSVISYFGFHFAVHLMRGGNQVVKAVAGKHKTTSRRLSLNVLFLVFCGARTRNKQVGTGYMTLSWKQTTRRTGHHASNGSMHTQKQHHPTTHRRLTRASQSHYSPHWSRRLPDNLSRIRLLPILPPPPLVRDRDQRPERVGVPPDNVMQPVGDVADVADTDGTRTQMIQKHEGALIMRLPWFLTVNMRA
ncbi:hypothetical protein LX36DRAFT_57580 [Colletotrichum falcatum]|nr:hypothetical protein LX36DRAFT_57580 [Colletotrichum falcatum]